MTNDLRETWSGVGDRIEALALKLKLHAESEWAAVDDDVTESLGRVRDAVAHVTDSFGDVARDPAVKDDVREIADALADALEASAERARELLRRVSS